MSSIPASALVQVTPSVLAAGGTGLNGTGLFLTQNTRVPIGTVQSFPNETAVSSYFGPGAIATDAGIYFAGFEGSSITPSALLMAQYNSTAVAAYLRGGNISGLSLAQLQAIDGTLDVLIDGVAHNGSVNLSSATSQTSAATIIGTAINGSLATLASGTGVVAAETFSVTASIGGYLMTVTAVANGSVVTGATISGTGVTGTPEITGQISGTPGGIGVYSISVSQGDITSETISGTYGQLTVSGSVTGDFAVGQTLAGTDVVANTIITQLGTGVGGDGTYFVNNNTAVSSTTISGAGTPAVVTYDSVSGAFVITSGIIGAPSTAAFATGAVSATLLLTSATGAVLSQGAAAATPAAFMTALVTTNSSWVNFMTHFDPDGSNGNTVKQEFAAWKNTAQGGNRFGYFCWDPDESPAASTDAASSLGQILKANGDSGTLLIWEGGATLDNGLCAFALGLAASINYQQTNGQANFAYRQQAGLVANVTDPTTAANLLANGYCFYGDYASAGTQFLFFQNGQITGPYLWADLYESQIWLNSQFQLALLTMQQNALSVPFTQAGAGLINGAMQSVISQGLAFGAFAPNTLNASQIADVNEAAGTNIADTLQAQGYYTQINIPNQTVQSARGPWPITFWYIGRNGVNTIDLSSVLVQ